MTIFAVLARPLVAAPFLLSGIDAAAKPVPHRERAARLMPLLEKAGIPEPSPAMVDLSTRATGAVMIVASAALALGKFPRLAGLTVGAVQVPLALANNPVWELKGADRRAAIGGLVQSLGMAGGAVAAGWAR